MKTLKLTLAIVLLHALTACAEPPAMMEKVHLPQGFDIAVWAEALGARSMVLSENGTLFVGTRDQGKVYALRDEDGDRRAEQVSTIASGLDSPNGVALRHGDLYVAEVSRILRFKDIESQLNDPPVPEVVYDDYPAEGHHGWKYIAFGPDGLLYVPVGAPCNVCDAPTPFSSITRLDVDSGEVELYARGIRNTVGFDWHPETGVLWFSNNGRDFMGDTQPPDSIHSAASSGLDFGFPQCHAGVPDPEFGEGVSCSRFAPAALLLPAHVAPLGVLFYTGEMFPEAYRNRLLIAEHGSWNRSTRVGYRVTMATVSDSTASNYETFADGWLLENEERWGRPVDLVQMPDGAVLVSDDLGGRIYRIWYNGE